MWIIDKIGVVILYYLNLFYSFKTIKIMWTIIPNDDDKIEVNGKQLCRIGFTYLHGKLQDEVNTDLYDLIKEEIPNVNFNNDSKYYLNYTMLSTGIYPCKYNNKECSLYFWTDKMNRPHGLIIYNDDVEELDYVLEQYNLRSVAI